MVAYTFSPSTSDLCESETSLVYIVTPCIQKKLCQNNI